LSKASQYGLRKQLAVQKAKKMKEDRIIREEASKKDKEEEDPLK